MKKTILLILFLLWVAPSWAQDDVAQMYSDAMAASRQGNTQKAVDMLRDIADNHADHHIADDAVFQLGTLLEKKLGDYTGAQEAYQRVMEKYPTSKNARRARKRFEYLAKARETGDEPLRIYNQILQSLTALGDKEGLTKMQELYEKYPKFNRRDQVLFWIAETQRRMNDYAGAIKTYETLRNEYPESRWSFFGYEKTGQLYIELREFDNAIAIFEGMSKYESRQPGATNSGQQMIALVKRFQTLRRLYFLSLGLVAGFFLLWIARTKWRQVGAPEIKSALFDVGISAFIVIVALFFSFGKPGVYRNTLIFLWFGLAAAAFCNHLYVKTNNLGIISRILLSVALFMVGAAVVYAVYYQTDVVNLLYDSAINNRSSGGPV